MVRKPPFYFFASFSIDSITTFINIPDSSKDLMNFMVSAISSFEIINSVVSNLRTFLWVLVSHAHCATVNPYGIKTLLDNGFKKFLINSNPVFSNGPRSLPRNPPDSTTIIDGCVFDK